jgi:poly(glycerol-phosphate) alpha-glucosyltransferase
MKTVLVTSRLSQSGGGISAAVEALSRNLLSTGADVHVVGIDDHRWHIDHADWSGAPFSAFPTRGPAALGYAPDMLSELHDLNAAIVHTHGMWTYPSRAVSEWASHARRPYVVSPHGMLDPWALRNARWKKKIAGLFYENTHLRRANCLHALCEAEARSIRQLGFKNPICVIPNGVTLPPANTHRSSPPWHNIIRSDANVMLFLGRLHPKKNLTAFLDAWSRATDMNWHLVIAGWDQGGHQKHLEASIDHLGLNKCVHVLGPLFGHDKDLALRHARAFVLPSLSEGLPMAVLEAWSYRLPVLMTDACNLPEGFHASAAAHLSLQRDEMVQDLRSFLSFDRSDLDEMGRQGRRLVETHFSWSSVAHQMRAVYKWLVNNTVPPSSVRTTRDVRLTS